MSDPTQDERELKVEEGRMSGPDYGSEPLAGEGADEEEATVTQGPGHGGSTGRAGEGTAEDARTPPAG